jgi:micrococcal nuclease
VDAPETNHPTRGQEPFGAEASQCLKDIIGGQRIRLERDADERDRYGRLLAHVHTESGVYVNEELLQRGCAKLFVIGANVSHIFELVKAQEEARKKGIGMWGTR